MTQTDEESSSPPKLLYFLVYNPLFGPGEGNELDRIIYYFPEEDSDCVKQQNVGLSEAAVNFSKIFDCDGLKVLTTSKTKTVFLR